MDSRQREEKERRDRAQREAEWRAREKAREAKAEREYQRALKAGGRVAAEAKWWRASEETAMAGRYELCQWEDEIEGEYTHTCFNRSTDVFCSAHNRRIDREVERNRKERAVSEVPTPREPAPAQVQVVRRAPSRSERRTNWHRRSSKPLDYSDPVYLRNRKTLLAPKPLCHWCKVRPASTADHLVGAPHGTHAIENLVPACERCNRLRGASRGGQVAKANRERKRRDR
jgi:5-methylcytosine-specific restriction endonuclease McrA